MFRRMKSLQRPERIFTHESDLDGLISGLLLKQLAEKEFGGTVKMEAHSYPSWRMRHLTERCAWVCDFTFEKRMDRQNWMILDHHTTDVKAVECSLIHDLKKSASLICYDLCNEHDIKTDALDRIVHLSNVADLFLEDDPDFRLAVDYANLVKTYGFWNMRELIQGKPENLLDHALLEVIQTKRRIEDPIGYAFSSKNIFRVTDEFGVVETVVGDSNSIVHRLLESGDTCYTVLATMYQKTNRQVMVSFRSRNGEALPIAKKFQGGGHANACGATMPKSVSSTDEAVLFMRQVIRPEPGTETGLASLESAFAGL